MNKFLAHYIQAFFIIGLIASIGYIFGGKTGLGIALIIILLIQLVF